jgi:glycosyltransferase involved in cell wall biosynthesis
MAAERDVTPSGQGNPPSPILSVLVPVFNERRTIQEVLRRIEEVPVSKEIIVVDDGSTDGTREILGAAEQEGRIRLVLHPENRGKGAAVSTGLGQARGQFVVVQDADLEYRPSEYPRLLEPLLDGCADAVYGTRFSGCHRVFMWWHYLGNRFLTMVTNILYNTMLTDMETGQKIFRRDLLEGLQIESKGFDFEPEITAKIFKRNARVYEIPIRYDGRGYDEGKKITWWDAFPAMWSLVKFRFKR